MCSTGANLGVSTGSVKQNARCFSQNPAVSPPFRKPAAITELQKWDEIFSRESEDISKLSGHIRIPGDQRSLESSDHRLQYTPVIIAIRFHLHDSPLPLQKPKQSRNRAAIARDELTHARRLPFGSANIVRHVVAQCHVSRTRRRHPSCSTHERSLSLYLARLLHFPDSDVDQLFVGAQSFPECS